MRARHFPSRTHSKVSYSYAKTEYYPYKQFRNTCLPSASLVSRILIFSRWCSKHLSKCKIQTGLNKINPDTETLRTLFAKNPFDLSSLTLKACISNIFITISKKKTQLLLQNRKNSQAKCEIKLLGIRSQIRRRATIIANKWVVLTRRISGTVASGRVVGSREKRLALFFRISVHGDKGLVKRAEERGTNARGRRKSESLSREVGKRVRRKTARTVEEREKCSRREENGEGQVFMGTHNSWPLLKLPPENGLRRLARNLSKFPGRVIYSRSGRSFSAEITKSVEYLFTSPVRNCVDIFFSHFWSRLSRVNARLYVQCIQYL